jgi:hypothetical protein
MDYPKVDMHELQYAPTIVQVHDLYHHHVDDYTDSPLVTLEQYVYGTTVGRLPSTVL